MPDPLYNGATFDKLLPTIAFQSPGVSQTIPVLNVSTIVGGGGGGSASANPVVSTLTLCDPTTGKGAIQFGILPGIPAYNTLVQQNWGDESGDMYQITLNEAGGAVDYLGCRGLLVNDGTPTTGNPFGVIEAFADGVAIKGADGTGKTTAVWYEAHNGFNKVGYVSTMTNSQKTYTLDFNAFLSTMASVYPAIVQPFAP